MCPTQESEEGGNRDRQSDDFLESLSHFPVNVEVSYERRSVESKQTISGEQSVNVMFLTSALQ